MKSDDKDSGVTLIRLVLILGLPMISMACPWICSAPTTLPNGETQSICLALPETDLAPLCFEGPGICIVWETPCTDDYIVE